MFKGIASFTLDSEFPAAGVFLDSFEVTAFNASSTVNGGESAVVHIGAWQPRGGQPNNSRNELNAEDLKLQLSWRVGNASDSVTVDLPFGGTSFCIFAEEVKASVVGSSGAQTALPMLSGFITASAGRVYTSPLACPTLTSRRFTVAGGQGGTIDVPPRAVGYRVFSTDFPDDDRRIQLSQLNNTLDVTFHVEAIDNAVENVENSGAGPLWAANRAAFFPLHPNCTSLEFSATDDQLLGTFILQFAISTGC